MNSGNYTSEAVSILKSLIEIPSTSRNEEHAADFIANTLEKHGLKFERIGINYLKKHFVKKRATRLHPRKVA